MRFSARWGRVRWKGEMVSVWRDVREVLRVRGG